MCYMLQASIAGARQSTRAAADEIVDALMVSSDSEGEDDGMRGVRRAKASLESAGMVPKLPDPAAAHAQQQPNASSEVAQQPGVEEEPPAAVVRRCRLTSG